MDPTITNPFYTTPTQRIPSYPQLMSCGLLLQSALGDSRVVRTLLSLTRYRFWIQMAMTFLSYPSPLTMDFNIAPMPHHLISPCYPLLLTQLLRLVLHPPHDVSLSRSCGLLAWVTAVNGNLGKYHCMPTAHHPNFFLTHCDLLIIRNKHEFVSNRLVHSRNKHLCRDSDS